MFDLPKKMLALPTFRESVETVVSAENLKAVASRAAEPEVVLGLALLSQTGNAVRRELSEMAVRAEPAYAPIVALLPILLDGIDELSLGELIKRDPDNALGYYLQGTMLYQSARENEALVAFRKAAHCSELRLYESTTGSALFKALDALGLAGHDRLCASSWMARRSSDFSNCSLQLVSLALSDLALIADASTRREIPGLLVVLASHLFSTNFCNRWFAKGALENALFGMKARLTGAGNSLQVNGYSVATRDPVGAMLRWPGIEVGMESAWNTFGLARRLPASIHKAFALADASRGWDAYVGEINFDPRDQANARFEQSRENATTAATALMDAALSDADEILGAYLKGMAPAHKGADSPPRARHQTSVETLIGERPDLFKAAAANEAAIAGLFQSGESDPWRRNMTRMMEINWALHRYASEHENSYPESIDVLFEKGYLKPPLRAKSLLTGRSYVYVAAGEKRPPTSRDSSRFVTLYDDRASPDGYVPCVLANWMASTIRVDELKAQLRKKGKGDSCGSQL